jgi:uncharacterized protein YdeI (YjbR/CyaY-like superfamily)
VRDISGALHFSNRQAWRRWLERNHKTKDEALLTIYKRAPKNASFSNHVALEEALCFGWIDGWFKPIDDERWVIRFSPRRRGSNWSKYNIARAWKLLNEGRMTDAGIAKLPRDVFQVWERYRPSSTVTENRGAQGGEIKFSDGKDYLSKVKLPARSP